jgi:2,3-bisphosphoglycerate-dependent phosphoglycerate mutase
VGSDEVDTFNRTTMKSHLALFVALLASLMLEGVIAFGLPRRPKLTSLGISSRVEETAPKPVFNDYEPEEYEEYSSSLSPKEERADVLSEGLEYLTKRPAWKKAARKTVNVVKKVFPKKKTGALILLRCGQSEFNANQTFTGWMDPDLTEQGIKECEHASRLLLAEGYEPDVVYTSRLKRAIKSTWYLLEGIDALFTPVFKTYRLNQRCYGSLEGLSKKDTAKELGAEVVQAWRNSLKARPPPVKKTDPHYHGHDRRYSDLPEDRIPLTESLLDCQERARPLWDHKIRKDIENGKTVLVVAHRDTLRGVAKVIDGISDDDIREVNFPNGVPCVYRFDENENPIEPAEGSLSQLHTSAMFLEKPGLLTEALNRQQVWSGAFSNLDGTHVTRRVSTMEDALMKLRVEQSLVEETSDGSYTDEDGDVVKLLRSAAAKTNKAQERWSDDPSEFEEYDFFAVKEEKVPANVVPLSEDSKRESKAQDDAVVVLIRHG